MLCNESLADEGGQVCVSAGKATDSLTLCFDPPPTATAPGSGAASPCLSEVTSSFGLQQSEGPSVSAGVEAGWLAEGCWQEGLAVYCVASSQLPPADQLSLSLDGPSATNPLINDWPCTARCWPDPNPKPCQQPI